MLDHFQKMLNLGVKMVSGSDSAWMHYPMGGFQYEIIGHAEWGMANIDAIISGTGAAAECIGLGDTVGTLEVGKKADILIVDGDPISYIWDLLNVNTVFFGWCKSIAGITRDMTDVSSSVQLYSCSLEVS